MTLGLRTPFGWPVGWAEVRLTGSAGDWAAHRGRQGLVVWGRRLGHATPDPLDDFLLCVVGDGLVRPVPVDAVRSSQLAQAAFVEAFLASDEVDVLWRLRDAVKAADARLATWPEGRLCSTLTALFVAGDGTAYGVSVGSSPLLVLSPGLDQGRVQTLGREHHTAVGTGETTSELGGVVEQWWPDMEGDGTRTRLEPGTVLVLAGAEKDLENGSGVAVRFEGGQGSTSQLVAESGWLVAILGHRAGGAFGLACLSDGHGRPIVPGLLRAALELEGGGLEHCCIAAAGDVQRTPLVVVGSGENGGVFAAGGASGERAGEDASRGDAFTLRLGSDPLDRGVPIAFQQHVEQRESRRRGWRLRLVQLWRRRWMAEA